jgi:hypothetical protein
MDLAGHLHVVLRDANVFVGSRRGRLHVRRRAMRRNVNPDSLIAEDGRFTKYFGKHASFERPEKLVILLDKYDAALRRGRCTHDQAIASLREVIANNHRFCGDHGFLELIEDLDKVMKVPEVLEAAAL